MSPLMARTTDQTATDDPVLGLLAKRKAEAVAQAEKEHEALASAAKLYARGAKLVEAAEDQLRQGREKQDAAIAAMLDSGLDAATVGETLGLAPKAITDAVKRHRGTPVPAKKAAAAARGPRAKASEPDAPPAAGADKAASGGDGAEAAPNGRTESGPGAAA